MCTLMDEKYKMEFEESYNIFKEDYGHIATIMEYVDVGWARQNYYCAMMWRRYQRLLFHVFADTTKLIE